MSRSGPAFACPPGAPLYNGVSRFNVGESRRDGRVAEGARLESVYTGNRIVGSNPTLSASAPRSIPASWVTVHTGDIGNTFGPNGLAMGSSLHVTSSKYPRS